MKKYTLDKEERELLTAYESGKLKSVPKLKEEVARARANAHYTLTRNKAINIRLTPQDLLRLKQRAAEKGLPYQTLVASIIHQYNNGLLKESV
ncbi:MAG: hypothetical protein COV10_00355 [Candidatus Vogelbacteria bacterium CG10_big_fil_rev_8_21_14_0_10_51_16]|uniref:Antitoxin n=1 Tax=Candidatus Vogelbacteria bacterium CG10_big_fil_rev_8_21_14_0_10_51_16 TaxID=1975045 RepID=A0A2H0RHI3_9BACT|nr:MAG: hypothetical protein COV10_00355 [Candidatus Vogelbacteria bacterium CG10_big_fil_rev_8_21_14_0_10_51_16]